MLDTIILLLTCSINFALGVIIYSRNVHSNYSRAFLAISLSICGWMVSNYITNLPAIGLLFNDIFNRFAYLFAFLATASGVWFSINFPFVQKRTKKYIFWLTIFIGSISVLSLTSLVAGHVTKKGDILHFSVGPLLPLYILGIISLLFIVVYNLSYGLRHSIGLERQQIIYVIAGFTVPGMLGVITNAILPALTSNWQSSKVGPIFTIFLVGSIAYSIIRHKLFDIRLAAVRFLAYVLSVLVIVLIYMALVFELANNLFGASLTTSQELLLAFFSVLISLLFAPVKRWFDSLTSKLFYQDAYNPQDLLNDLNRTLVSTSDIDVLLKGASELLAERLKAEFCVVMLLNPISKRPQVVGTMAKRISEEDFMSAHSTHLRKERHGRIIVTDALGQEDATLRRLLIKNEIAVIARLGEDGTNKELGHLILGPKRSGNIYSEQDARLIETIVNEMALAIQNALRFEEIQNFNETLQARIATATQKLSETNQRLKKLDETKDEFISMASHQLRTPLTSVKGYLSMVLEGDAGNLNKNQRKLLEQSFVSSQRMVYLISDLLNLSRLNTGRFVIEATPIDLSDVIRDEINQLAETAKSRELKMVYKQPEHFPTLMLDENKIHQVVMNFLDNAIYYTPSGGTVTAELQETPTAITFTVKDTGIGVPRSVQHKLFTKFYRAQNAQQARPDGTGLGLFMAKKVVAAQGGSLIFESAEGKGSTFGFRFSKSRIRVPSDPALANGKAAAETAHPIK